jgi:hypothetical protein
LNAAAFVANGQLQPLFAAVQIDFQRPLLRLVGVGMQDDVRASLI